MDNTEQLESEEGLNLFYDTIYPDASVKISRDQYSTFELKRMIEDAHELQLSPPFQRHKVWKIEQKRELIESLLMGIPIPVIYMFESSDGMKQMVDGRQRVGAIVDFMNDQFKLDKLCMLPAFNGAKFSDLEPLYRSKLERYQLFVYVIEPPTPERVKYDIFDRVNRGGTQLNSQEMRNALYQGFSTELLSELSESDTFIRATGGGIKSKRMRDHYVILRFLSFYLWRRGLFEFEYKSNIDDFLAESMKVVNHFSAEQLDEVRSCFQRAMDGSMQVLGEDAFRFAVTNLNRRPINMPLFEVLAYFFAIANIERVEEPLLRSKLNILKQDFDQGGFFSGRVDSRAGVEYRFGMVEQLKDYLEC
jgi:hypothetical protein